MVVGGLWVLWFIREAEWQVVGIRVVDEKGA